MKRRTFLTTAALAALAALAEQVANLRAATAGMKIKLGACDWTMQLAENAGVIYGIESTLKVPVLEKILTRRAPLGECPARPAPSKGASKNL